MANVLRLSVLSTVVLMVGCGMFEFNPNRKEEEAGKNTIECQYQGERILIRYGKDEVRILMPDAERVDLYKVPSPRGTMYSNGRLEFLNRGAYMTLGEPGEPHELTCKPYDPSVDKEQEEK